MTFLTYISVTVGRQENPLDCIVKPTLKTKVLIGLICV